MKLMTLIFCILFSVSAMAVCSETTNVCASHKTDVPFSTSQEGRFTLLLNAELVKVDLWMGTHGHGSSPLKVTQTAPGQFDITKAYFVMRGPWQIRVTYKKGTVQETLIIPVNIQE